MKCAWLIFMLACSSPPAPPPRAPQPAPTVSFDCTGLKVLDLGAARYRVQLCGDYARRSIEPYNIQVGSERAQASANESGLSAVIATRPVIGDRVYIWFYGTQIFWGTVTAAHLADLGP